MKMCKQNWTKEWKRAMYIFEKKKIPISVKLLYVANKFTIVENRVELEGDDDVSSLLVRIQDMIWHSGSFPLHHVRRDFRAWRDFTPFAPLTSSTSYLAGHPRWTPVGVSCWHRLTARHACNPLSRQRIGSLARVPRKISQRKIISSKRIHYRNTWSFCGQKVYQ